MKRLIPVNPNRIQRGDVVGIGIHTTNALRGYEIGRLARQRGAYDVLGGIHATLNPEEAQSRGRANAVVKGDADIIWTAVLEDCRRGAPGSIYSEGRVEGPGFVPARWDLVPRNRYMWASVQTVRGCPKHCSFCSVWRTDGQRPRKHASDAVMEEIVRFHTTDSARIVKSARWARWPAKPCRYLFSARPMPQLQAPKLTNLEISARLQQIEGSCHAR
jgi:radical SAM superfamily enzyme YgiQ (UPF0313 family)